MIQDTIANMISAPYSAVADLAGHALTGYFLTKEFYPYVGRVETGLKILVGGFLPDADFIIPEVNHRKVTHNGGAFVLPLVSSLFFKSKAKALAFLGLGTFFHLCTDSLGTLEERLTYVGAASVALALQKYANLRDQNENSNFS